MKNFRLEICVPIEIVNHSLFLYVWQFCLNADWIIVCYFVSSCCSPECDSGGSLDIVIVSLATKIFEDFGGMLCKEFIIGREPVSTVHFTWPGTCIKWPTPN